MAERQESETEIPMLPDGCGYMGHEFGARYLDSQCFGGQLYDLDNCDDSGNLYEPGEYIACPQCHMEEWLEGLAEDVGSGIHDRAESSLPMWQAGCRFVLGLDREKALALLNGRFRTVTYVTDDDDLTERTWEFSESQITK